MYDILAKKQTLSSNSYTAAQYALLLILFFAVKLHIDELFSYICLINYTQTEKPTTK